MHRVLYPWEGPTGSAVPAAPAAPAAPPPTEGIYLEVDRMRADDRRMRADGGGCRWMSAGAGPFHRVVRLRGVNGHYSDAIPTLFRHYSLINPSLFPHYSLVIPSLFAGVSSPFCLRTFGARRGRRAVPAGDRYQRHRYQRHRYRRRRSGRKRAGRAR